MMEPSFKLTVQLSTLFVVPLAYLPLVPVYKGDTNLEGIHPISRLRYGPCDFEGISNDEFRKIAKKIAMNLKSEGTIDMDLIYSREENKVYAIEINTRPSGTRY